MTPEQIEEGRRMLELRPEVAAFAQLMEQKLRANDHKGGWKQDAPGSLLRRIAQELDELRRVVNGAFYQTHHERREGEAGGIHGSNYVYRYATEDERAALLPQIGPEAADVANFAMMVADVCGALPDALPTLSAASRVGALEAERDRLREALTKSVELQSHYATLLNQYDGGKRMTFETAEAWMERLQCLK